MTAPTYSWSRPRVPRTAGLGARIAAFTLDMVVVGALTFAAWKLAGPLGFLPEGDALGQYGFLVVAESSIGLTYFTIAEAAAGRTIGKALVGLRVATLAGGEPSAYQAFLRNLLRFVWLTPLGPIFVLIDAYLLATTEMDQRLGDLAAGTIVADPEGEAAAERAAATGTV